MATQDSTGRWVSLDGWYWWDGNVWRRTPSGVGCAMAALTSGIFVLAFVAFVTVLIFGVLDGLQVPMALVSGVASVALAWIGGRLAARGWTPDGRLTEQGMSMVVSLWIATAGMAWAYLVLLVVIAGQVNPAFSTWALGTWVLSPTASVALISGILILGVLDLWYSQFRFTAPYRWPVAGGDGSAGGDGDIDARGIALAILAVTAASLAAVTVWLIARASSGPRGLRLSFLSAFAGRPPHGPDRLSRSPEFRTMR